MSQQKYPEHHIALRKAVRANDIATIERTIKDHPVIFDELQSNPDWVVIEAAKFASPETIALMIKLGGDPNETDSNQRTPVSAAIAKDRIKVVETLGFLGADLNIYAPLVDVLLLNKRVSDPIAMMRALLDAGADVNQIHESEGWGQLTATKFAIASGDKDSESFLRSWGGRP